MDLSIFDNFKNNGGKFYDAFRTAHPEWNPAPSWDNNYRKKTVEFTIFICPEGLPTLRGDYEFSWEFLGDIPDFATLVEAIVGAMEADINDLHSAVLNLHA